MLKAVRSDDTKPRSCKRSDTLVQKSLILFSTWREYFNSQSTHFSSQPKKDLNKDLLLLQDLGLNTFHSCWPLQRNARVNYWPALKKSIHSDNAMCHFVWKQKTKLWKIAFITWITGLTWVLETITLRTQLFKKSSIFFSLILNARWGKNKHRSILFHVMNYPKSVSFDVYKMYKMQLEIEGMVKLKWMQTNKCPSTK